MTNFNIDTNNLEVAAEDLVRWWKDMKHHNSMWFKTPEAMLLRHKVGKGNSKTLPNPTVSDNFSCGRV